MTPLRSREIGLRVASVVLALGALGMGAASLAIMTPWPDLDTRVGRHVLAGALANLALSLVLCLIAGGPIRRGDRWGVWAYAIPFAVYGLPIVVVDATHVARERLAATLGPQILGMFLGVVGLGFAWWTARARPAGRDRDADVRDGGSR